MIFVTVGSQMPFDRLIECVDQWAARQANLEIFAQIGSTNFRPGHMQWEQQLSPEEFHRRMTQANAIVSHAGMGTILTALELGKRILVMPRRGDLHETRNDHQIATAKRFEQQGRLAVAYDQVSLMIKLSELSSLAPSPQITSTASEELLNRLRNFSRSF